MEIKTFEESEKDFDRSLRKMIAIYIIICAVMFILSCVFINNISNQIKNSGGLGKMIGNFIGEINSGIEQTNK